MKKTNEFMSELGDVMWYFALLADFFNITIEEILTLNIDKLEKRYPNGFEITKSIERKD